MTESERRQSIPSPRRRELIEANYLTDLRRHKNGFDIEAVYVKWLGQYPEMRDVLVRLRNHVLGDLDLLS